MYKGGASTESQERKRRRSAAAGKAHSEALLLVPRFVVQHTIDCRFLSVLLRERAGPMLLCNVCCAPTQAKGKNGYRCSACKVAVYCGQECQVKDWKKQHKVACKTLLEIEAQIKQAEAGRGDLTYGRRINLKMQAAGYRAMHRNSEFPLRTG